MKQKRAPKMADAAMSSEERVEELHEASTLYSRKRWPPSLLRRVPIVCRVHAMVRWRELRSGLETASP